MRKTGRSVLLVFGLTGSAVFVGSTSQIDPTPVRNQTSVIRAPNKPVDSVADAVKDAYMREFGEGIARPAIYIDPSGGGCGAPYLTTTAYFRRSAKSARLLYLFTSPDGHTVIRKFDMSSVVVPAGAFRVLSVITRHPATADESTLRNWEAAQAKINHDHARYAAEHGYSEPIVSFENTNVLAVAGDIADPRNPRSVREAVEQRGVATASYQFIASINLDPSRSEGGFAGAAGFVYMGNYGRWSRPLTAEEWVNVANAVYHHEVAHHWGWPGSHDWAPQCNGQSSYMPFIVPAILFGWEDVDGDGVPEILETTPYGGSQ